MNEFLYLIFLSSRKEIYLLTPFISGCLSGSQGVFRPKLRSCDCERCSSKCAGEHSRITIDCKLKKDLFQLAWKLNRMVELFDCLECRIYIVRNVDHIHVKKEISERFVGNMHLHAHLQMYK